jgi:flagellar basal body P-ring formation protein FlgA
MKRNGINLATFAAFLLLAGVSSNAFCAVDVTLRDRVAPHASVVRLGDVADVSTADRLRARQLAAMPLMPAPAPGTERSLPTREIQDMLAAQGVDLGELRFAGAANVMVGSADGAGTEKSAQIRSDEKPARMNRHAAILAGERGERTVTQLDQSRVELLRQRLVSCIEDYVNARTGKVEPRKISCDVSTRELARLDAATTMPICTSGSEPWVGRQRFVVTYSTADGPAQLTVFADVLPPPVPAVVAIRPIGRGEPIKAADVELRTVEASVRTGQRTTFDSIEKIIGMEARQSIQAGDIVSAEQVQSPILVKRGDVITVSSQSGGIRVRTSAKALHDGAHGDLVQVESLASREKFDARVVGPREATVFAVTRPGLPQAERRSQPVRR